MFVVRLLVLAQAAALASAFNTAAAAGYKWAASPSAACTSRAARRDMLRTSMSTVKQVRILCCVSFGRTACNEYNLPLCAQVSTEEFETTLQECKTPIVVDMCAAWCTPCKKLAPELEAAAAHFGDKCRFLKVDVDEEPEVGDTLNVVGLPTVLFINEMRVVARTEGMLTAVDLQELSEHYFFGGPKPACEADIEEQSWPTAE